MKHYNAYQDIGKLFFKTGLAEIFGIHPHDNIMQDSDHKTSLLFGFLKEAVDGNLQDPNNIHKWQKTGKSLLRS